VRKAGTTFIVTLTGVNLQGTSDVIFTLPSQFPGDRWDHGKGNGPDLLYRDSAFAISGITVNAAGTQITANVTVAAGGCYRCAGVDRIGSQRRIDLAAACRFALLG
jgi:hypothetical protein